MSQVQDAASNVARSYSPQPNSRPNSGLDADAEAALEWEAGAALKLEPDFNPDSGLQESTVHAYELNQDALSVGSHEGDSRFGGKEHAGPIDPGTEEAMLAVDFTTLTEQQVQDIESGNPQQIARALNLQETPETPPDDMNTQVAAPSRISLKAIADPEERRALAEATRMLRDGRHTNLRDALEEALGLRPAVAAATDKVDVSVPNKERVKVGEVAASQVRELAGKIAQLEEERRLAKAEYDYEQSEALLEQITGLKLGLRDAQLAQAGKNPEVTQWIQGEEESRNRAAQLFPDLGDENSVFFNLVEDEIVLAELKEDDIFNTPEWPERIARRVSEKYGFTSGGGTVEPVTENNASSRIPTPPFRGVRLPGSPVGPVSGSAAVSAHVALEQLAQLPLDDQDAVLALLDMNEQRARARRSGGRAYAG